MEPADVRKIGNKLNLITQDIASVLTPALIEGRDLTTEETARLTYLRTQQAKLCEKVDLKIEWNDINGH